MTGLFADKSILVEKSEEKLQKVMNELYMVFIRRKLKANAGNSKIMAFERRESKVLDASVQFRINKSTVVI